MDEDEDDLINNDEETRAVADAAKNAARKGAEKIKKEGKAKFKATWKKIPLGVRITIYSVLIILTVASVFFGIFFIQKLFGDNNTADSAMDKFISEHVSIAKSSGRGYYYKIDKNAAKEFVKYMNKAYDEGAYDEGIDIESDSDENNDDDVTYIKTLTGKTRRLSDVSDEDSEKLAEEALEDDDTKQETLEDVTYDESFFTEYFKTENLKDAEAYFIKMVRAEIAGSYPRIGSYNGEDDTEDSQGNMLDEDGDYVAQGMIKIERSNTEAIQIKAEETIIETESKNVRMALKKYNGMEYYEIRPKNLKIHLPLILYLHDDAQVNNFKSFINLDITKYITNGSAYESGEFIFIAPHSTKRNWTDASIEESVMKLIETVAEQYSVDFRKIIVIGSGRGATGTWNFVNNNVDYFAAAVPSNGTHNITASNFKNTAVKAICGNNNSNKMQKLVDQINEAGGNAEKEVFEGGSNTECFARKEVFDWILAQRIGLPTKTRPQIKDSEDSDKKNGKKTQLLNATPGTSEVQSYAGLQYYVTLPEEPTTDMPIVVYLHSLGPINSKRASDAMGEWFPQYVASGEAYMVEKFILIVPYTSDYWQGKYSSIMQIIDYVADTYQADKTRISACGFSHGSCVLGLVGAYPDRFSAVMPVGGGYGYTGNINDYVSTAVWAIQGADESWWGLASFCEQINSAGGTAFFESTELNGERGHSGIYMCRPEVVEWLINQVNDVPLRYCPYDEFKEMVKNNDPRAIRCFSFDDIKKKIIFVTYTSISINGNITYKLKERSVSFRAYSELGNIPFNFLFALLQRSESPDYVMAVADLLLEETDIIIMIQDQNRIIDYYQETASVLKTETLRRRGKTGIIYYQRVKYSFPEDPTEKLRRISDYNSAIVFVKRANTWCLDFEQEAVRKEETKNNVRDNTNEYTDADFQGLGYSNIVASEEPIKLALKPGEIDKDIPLEEQKKYPNIQTTNTYIADEKLVKYVSMNTKNITWDIVLKKKELNYERFLGLWKNDTGEYYPGSLYVENGYEVAYGEDKNSKEKVYPAKNISSTEAEEEIDLLLELLSRHVDTQIHEQVMRYFWNVYKNKKVYEVDVDRLLDLFRTPTFITVGASRTKLPVFGCYISKEDFIECVQSGTTPKFAQYAEVIYDVCTNNNINPILCVAQAGRESSFVHTPSNNETNFWGLGVFNGQSTGISSAGMAETVQVYCNTILTWMGNEKCNERVATYAEYFPDKFHPDNPDIYSYNVMYKWLGTTHEGGAKQKIQQYLTPYLSTPCNHGLKEETTWEERAADIVHYIDEGIIPIAERVFGDLAFTSSILGSFDGEVVEGGKYYFPHYIQDFIDYPFGTSTISRSGCGPTSLAIILAGLLDNADITPETLVDNLAMKYANGGYVQGKGCSHAIWSSEFLQEYYGVISVEGISVAEALNALQAGFPVIGGMTGHILAIVPPTENQKAEGYQFQVVDSSLYTRKSGVYTYEQAVRYIENFHFYAIIYP